MYGWCNYCAVRVGHRNFRELIEVENDRKCSDCARRWATFEPNVSPPKQRVKVSQSKKKVMISSEEWTLLEYLQSESWLGAYWRKKAAMSLGWSENKLRNVARSIRRKKLWKFSRVDVSASILNLLDSPKTAYQIAEELPFTIGWITQVLNKLVTQGNVTVLRPSDLKKPYIYSKQK